MKKLLILSACCLLAAGAHVQAQSNAKATAYNKTLGYSGNFNYPIEDNRSVNINYLFTPLVPTDVVNFTWHTPTARPISLKIVDLRGSVVASYQPEEYKYFQSGTLDVKHLKAGKYQYQIYWENDLAISIPFTKK